jgi:hypothetical protein
VQEDFSLPPSLPPLPSLSLSLYLTCFCPSILTEEKVQWELIDTEKGSNGKNNKKEKKKMMMMKTRNLIPLLW